MTDWHIEGEWVKNCNCDAGCPCDFNARPTRGFCEGMAAMRITTGHFGDVDLAGVIWGAVVRWPGALHEGNGEMVPFVDEATTDAQRDAVLQFASGQHGDSFMQVFAHICPTVHAPVVAPIEWKWDIGTRTGHIKVGDLLETEIDTMRGIDPPEPYRVIVRIPNGMEYTGPNEEAETALAKTLTVRGAIEYEVTDGHSSMAYVRHGNEVDTGAHNPTVVEASR